MIEKKEFVRFGAGGIDYISPEHARKDTYNNKNNESPPTPLICKANPFNDEIKNAKFILEIGCGIGRNVPWIMENTNAIYYGIDPNDTMLKYFWDITDKKWKSRVKLYSDFEFEEKVIFDVVVSIFVFQHIGYGPESPIMNVTDITKEIRKYTIPGKTIWFMFEHDTEERSKWQDRWFKECNIEPEVYIKDWNEFPELPDSGHNLIIFRERNNG